MKLSNILKSTSALALGAVIVVSTSGIAKADYPEKPIKLMVGFSAGGGTDTTARGFASYVHEAPGMNGMPMVVVNKPGGSGMQAAKVVKQAKPDGYTLYIINSGTFAAADMSTKNAPVQPLNDFVNLGCMTQLVTSLQIPAGSPHKSAADWVKAMKASGKKIRWSTSGASTMHALVGHLFLDTAGLSHQVIPFKGGSKARNALMAGKVDAAFNGAHLVAGFEKSIRAVGVPTAKRDPANKKVPTFAEQGLPALNVAGPMCLWGKKGLPADVTAKLQGAVKAVAGLKGFGRFMKKSKLAAFHLTTDQGTSATKALYDTLGPVVKKVMAK
jgi:tripartite-type tricarboxylate transporter receptor subunit TctC